MGLVFLGSMHWIVSPFLIYEKHFFFSPFVVIIFPFDGNIFFNKFNLNFRFRKKFDLKIEIQYLKSFFISLFFFFTEFLRSYIFGGLPLNLTAHIWAFHSEFIQIAKFFGVFGLSFLTINWVVLVALNILLKKRKTAFFIFLFFPFFLLVADQFLKFEIVKDKNLMEIPVRVVQPNIPQIEKWNRLLFQENLEKLIGLTLINNKPDEKKIVIWPEVAVTSYFNEDQELNQYLNKKSQI